MDTLAVVTQCRNCQKVSASKFLLPLTLKEFPRECEVCGQKRVGPAPAGLLDKMEPAFDAQRALLKLEGAEVSV